MKCLMKSSWRQTLTRHIVLNSSQTCQLFRCFLFAPMVPFKKFALVAQRVERFSVSVLHAHPRRAGNYTCLLSNTALWLSIDSKLLVLFQHLLIPCDSQPLHLFQYPHIWRQNFVIEVSVLCFFSPSFSTSDSQASIFSDEFPCHSILIRF